MPKDVIQIGTDDWSKGKEIRRNLSTYHNIVVSVTSTKIFGTSVSAGSLGPPQEQSSGGGQLG